MADESSPRIVKEYDHPLRFTYHGEEREVRDAVERITQAEGNRQIAGRQVRKGDERTDEVRVFRKDRIEGPIEEVDE